MLGISLLTQLLYVLVFLTRYIDLFWVPPSFSYWNFVLKNFYIWSSLYIILLQLRIYPRTREKEKGWQLAIYAVLGSLLAAPTITPIFKSFTFPNILDTFSLVLESVCILPQLLLLRQTTVPTVITSFYLLTLGSYRFLYILNWIDRAANHDTASLNPISVIFGVVQTALYLDFAWVYWTRQRVKLRGGGVVDSDDLRKSWFVGNLLGGKGRSSTAQGRGSLDDDDEAHDDIEHQPGRSTGGAAANGNPRKPPAPNRWGKRGVSVSADDMLEEHEQSRVKQQQKNRSPKKGTERGITQERISMLKQPAEFEEPDDDDDGPLFSDADADAKPVSTGQQQVVLNSGEAWSGAGAARGKVSNGQR